MKKAFNEKNLDAIYFLSDGRPSLGQSGSIIKMVKAENKKRKKKVKIHATAFTKGKYGLFGENKKKARKFMKSLATATNGEYINVN